MLRWCRKDSGRSARTGGWVVLVAVFAAARLHAQTNAILFVTQVPVPADFTTVTATFGNHRPDLDSCGRGGDLWIRYPDGTLRNLTRAAGWGRVGDQSTNGIAVREPCVHWDGRKALFSMVVGAPKRRYDYDPVGTWQIYEIAGFANPTDVPVVTRVPGQPAEYNNVSPAYTADDRILFTSDRPRSGERHLYPQLDEYEEAPTVTGIWWLDPSTADLRLLNHTPSGAFNVSVDSFGRVVFIRWDHLQRDQQADADTEEVGGGGMSTYGTFNYTSESTESRARVGDRTELFPETRLGTARLGGHTFNQFFPWQINDDGTEEETLNHVGRHELGGSYRANSFRDDPNLGELYYFGDRFNTNTVGNFLHVRESAAEPGLYYGIDAPEFGTHAAGQIVALEGPPDRNADRMRLRYITPRVTAAAIGDGEPVPSGHTGLYRNPLPMADGTLVAVHTSETRGDRNEGSSQAPRSRYAFRLQRLAPAGGYLAPAAPLTTGIRQSVSYWSPDERVTYTNVLMWELDPVEVRTRSRPARLRPVLAPPELAAFAAEKVDVEVFRRSLAAQNLGVIVGRNATTRDRADFQQPFNLRVPGGVETLGAAGKVYDVRFLQIFQADQIRGLGLNSPGAEPRPGRRVVARLVHDPAILAASGAPDLPAGSTELSADGSYAAIVPARRALSWQLLNATEPVVRERYWITVQPGEIRMCTSCHGINSSDQSGRPAPTNSPLALRALLAAWKRTTVYPGSTQLPRFTIQSREAAGQLRLKAAVRPEHSATLEGSADLMTWEAVTNSAATDGAIEFGVPAASAARYFRLREAP